MSFSSWFHSRPQRSLSFEAGRGLEPGKGGLNDRFDWLDSWTKIVNNSSPVFLRSLIQSFRLYGMFWKFKTGLRREFSVKFATVKRVLKFDFRLEFCCSFWIAFMKIWPVGAVIEPVDVSQKETRVEFLDIWNKELRQCLQCHPFLDPRLRCLMGTGGSGDENNMLHFCFLSPRSLSAFSAYSSRPGSGPALPPLINSSLHKAHHRHTFSSFGQQSTSRTMLYRTFSHVSEEGDCTRLSQCGAMIMDLFRMKRIIWVTCFQFRVLVRQGPSNLARIIIHWSRNFLSVRLRWFWIFISCRALIIVNI